MKLYLTSLSFFILTVSLLAQNTEINITQTNGIGVNTANPTDYFHVEVPETFTEDGIFSQINRQANEDIKAFRGISITNPGFGIGGHFTGGFRGVYAAGIGGTYDANYPVYGIFSEATGTTGERIGAYSRAVGGDINIGMFSEAVGGDTNLAAKFGDGDVEVENLMRINASNSTGRLTISNSDNIGSYAAALRIYASNNGSETTYGSYVNASNSGQGTAIGFRADAAQEGDFAFYGIGDSYFTGDVRIGLNTNPDGGSYKLIVDGKILSEEVRVQNSADWPDYVFAKNYNLLPLPQVEAYIRAHHHLPNIPPAAEIEKEGIPLGQMQIKLMEKVEELTLHLIAQQKEIETLKHQVKRLSDEK